jgi:integrase
MAIDNKEFVNKIKTGLLADKAFSRFLFRFKLDGKSYRKIIDYSDKEWDKRTRISKAEKEANEFRESKVNPITELDENIKLDTFIKMHFDKLPNTSWTTTKIKHYENYLKKQFGNKKLTSIKQMHIKDVIKEQENLRLAPRTIKTTIELLNPVFKEAIANRVIDFNPCTGVTIKVPKSKKTVTNALSELEKIAKAIVATFEDDPYYLSLYLFALQGRRKNEILSLRWENIDFVNSIYLIEDTKNGEHQQYSMPHMIREELMKFQNSRGWVYESSINRGQHINNIEKQTKKLKKLLPNFTLHYLRNVIVSAMAQQGVSATLMSGALGHNNTSTLSKYLSLSYVEGSKEANKVIEGVLMDKN